MSTDKVKRTFTIEESDLGFVGGRYTGAVPSVAGRHAAKQLVRMAENKSGASAWKKYEKFASKKTIKFVLREATRGSTKLTYKYEATVVLLPTPKVIKRNGVEFTVTKTITVKSAS